MKELIRVNLYDPKVHRARWRYRAACMELNYLTLLKHSGSRLRAIVGAVRTAANGDYLVYAEPDSFRKEFEEEPRIYGLQRTKWHLRQ